MFNQRRESLLPRQGDSRSNTMLGGRTIRLRGKRPRAGLRRAAAIVEFAVCLPVLMLLTVAAIETCSMIYVRQSLTIAAYEGARVALIPGSETVNVQEQCRLILDGRGVRNATTTVTPDVVSSAPGTFIRVSVTAPCSSNSPIAGKFFAGRSLTGSVEMMKEM